jgi:hypothetical protein
MSTLSVTTVTTGLSTTDLTLSTGNTAAGDIVIQSDGLGIVLAGNSSSNTVDIAPNGHVGISNGSVNTFIMSSTGVLTIANTLTSKIFSGNTVLVKETLYTTAGTATHTKVANLVAMMVYCVGAGGGGGGATATAVATGAYGAAGGGGGGCSIKILTNAEIGATSNVVVGTGGTAGTTSAVSGTAGSNSSFANSTNGLITGQGGGGATGVLAGIAGAAINGDAMIPGEAGQLLLGTSVALAVSLSGAGGASGLGFGQGGGPSKNAVGKAGALYGGGGGGGAQGNTAASVAGGAGANGLVWVIEYYNGV